MSFPNALNCHILNTGLLVLVTPATLWASVTLVTGQTKSMGQSDPDIIPMSLVFSRRNSNTRHNTISLQHTDPGEHSPALMIRHRPARSCSRSYYSVSPRRHGRLTSRSRGKKKEHSKSHSSKRDKSMR